MQWHLWYIFRHWNIFNGRTVTNYPKFQFQEQKRLQDEKERKKAEVRARLEAAAQAKKGGGKKGFMTPARKKKLRVR